MESHPVPQNVTNFEFHLVGDMTLKQFMYFAAGLVTAYLLFAFLSDKVFPINAISWILIVISAGVGTAFAFLPIAERPLDHWVAAFFKAVFTPQRREWKSKRKDITKGDPVFQKRLQIYLSSINPFYLTEQALIKTTPKLGSLSQFAPQSQVVAGSATEIKPISQSSVLITPIQDGTRAGNQNSQTQPARTMNQQPYQQQPQAQAAYYHTVNTPVSAPQQQRPVQPNLTPPAAYPNLPNMQIGDFRNAQVPQQPHFSPPPVAPATINQPPAKTPDPRELTEIVELAKEAQIIRSKMLEAEKQLDDIKAAAAAPGANPADYTTHFQNIVSDLQNLSNKATGISKQLAIITKVEEVPNKKITIVPTIKKPHPQAIKLTSTPNIVNGIVSDAMGNYIEGVIVVTHDKEGLPVRALKTNKLGQFVAATPLQNGTYTMSLEKEGLVFDNIQIELDGTVIPPIEIRAKRANIVHSS